MAEDVTGETEAPRMPRPRKRLTLAVCDANLMRTSTSAFVNGNELEERAQRFESSKSGKVNAHSGLRAVSATFIRPCALADRRSTPLMDRHRSSRRRRELTGAYVQ